MTDNCAILMKGQQNVGSGCLEGRKHENRTHTFTQNSSLWTTNLPRM